jgi:hypothetical protein
MTINEQPLTPARWRRLHPHLRTELRQVLGPQAGILGRPVLEIARMLCARDAYLLAWHLCQGLDGQPHSPHQGCSLVFCRANLFAASLCEASLREANLCRAVLAWAVFYKADLFGANLTASITTSATLYR